MKKPNSNKPNDIGEALRLFRVFHDLTLAELSKKLEVSTSFISSIETGRKKPNLSFLKKYAVVFNTTPSAILFFSEELGTSKLPASISTRLRMRLMKFMQAIENGSAQ